MITEFTLANIGALDDARVETAFAQALSRVLADCVDRPGVETDRIINLQMRVCPVISEDGDLADTKVSFQVTDRIPTRKSKVYSMDIRRTSTNGGHRRQLVFNDMSEDNFDQKTFDETDTSFRDEK